MLWSPLWYDDMNKFFNPDNFLWQFFGRISDYFCLSILWLLCCLPMITIIPSCIALYDSVARCIRGDEGHPCKRFWRTFKAELKRGIFLTVLWVLIFYLLNVGYQFLNQMSGESQIAAVYAMVYYVTMFIPIGILGWLIPIESRFEYGLKDLHKTALLMSIGRLPTTLALVALLAVIVILTLVLPFMVMLTPAILAMLQSWFIERVFKQYMPAEEEPEHADAAV